MKRQFVAAGALLAAVSIIAACGGGSTYSPPAPAPTQAGAPTPVSSNSPTALPSGSPTQSPTSGPTGTPKPTFTPLPTASPTLSPTPSPMPSYLPNTVWPVFDCVSNVKSQFYWEFGYINSGNGSKSFAAGSADNLIEINGVAVSPQPQPTTFPSTGDVEAYRFFKVAVPGSGEQAITWTLDGNKIGPYGKEGVPACPE